MIPDYLVNTGSNDDCRVFLSLHVYSYSGATFGAQVGRSNCLMLSQAGLLMTKQVVVDIFDILDWPDNVFAVDTSEVGVSLHQRMASLLK